MSQEKFTLRCPQCGGTKFSAGGAKPCPGDTLTCAGCGTSVNLAEVKARVERETRAAIEERLRDQLKPK